jgi:hypothetical protein
VSDLGIPEDDHMHIRSEKSAAAVCMLQKASPQEVRKCHNQSNGTRENL